MNGLVVIVIKLNASCWHDYYLASIVNVCCKSYSLILIFLYVRRFLMTNEIRVGFGVLLVVESISLKVYH